MARRSGQNNRAKKQSRPMKAVSKSATAPRAETTDAAPVEEALASETVAVPAPTPVSNNGQSRSGRKTRPYQQRKAPATARSLSGSGQALTISRDQEYGFIRKDLQHLILIAGVLTVVMIALLFVVDR